MTDDLIAAVEKVVPCDGYREEPSRDPIQIGGSGRFNSPTVYRCSGDRHIKGCSALLRPSVLALVRERVEAAEEQVRRGFRDILWQHERELGIYEPQSSRGPTVERIVKASVAEARRPLVESLRHEVSCVTCAEDGCSTCEDCVALILLAAEKKGETG